MTTEEFKRYWKYYLVLEKDVLNIEPFVAFHEDNYGCFSNEFIKIFQAICSEIDVICKVYCDYFEQTHKCKGRNPSNILQYAACIINNHPEIITQTVDVFCDIESPLVPWAKWNEDSPEWWQKYNKVKHHRTEKDSENKYYYQYANLKNVLNALAALCVLEKYFYADLYADTTERGNSPYTVIAPPSRLFAKFKLERAAEVFTSM